MTLPAVRHDLTSLPARDRGQQDDSHNDWTYETGSAHPWRDVDHVEIETLNWVDRFNTERPHEYLSDLTPARAEELHYIHISTPTPVG